MQFVSFWNRVYYSLYDFHYFWSEYLLGRMLERMHRPFYSSVTQEEYDEIRGIIKNLKENPKGGLLMIYTSYSMTYILVGIEICIICMLQMIAGINCWSIGIIPLLIIIGGLSMLFCYFVLWKKDVKHVLTHRVILTDFFLLEVNEPPALPPDYIWIEEIDFERCAKPRLIESLLENLP